MKIQAFKNRGFYEIEALLGFLLLGILLLGFSQTLRQSLKVYLQTEQELEKKALIAKLDSFLRKVMIDFDGHRFALYPRIHPPGEILFSDGSANPIMQSAANAPAKYSQALTGLELSSLDALTINMANASGTNLLAKACRKYPGTHAGLSTFKTFLAMSVDGSYELSGSAQSLGPSSKCYELHLSYGKSISMTQQDPANLSLIRALIPIKSHYTVYLSKNKQLRFLSHANEQNLENQPLLDLKQEFEIAFMTKQQQGIFFAELELHKSGKILATLFANNFLSREDLLNFVLNRV